MAVILHCLDLNSVGVFRFAKYIFAALLNKIRLKSSRPRSCNQYRSVIRTHMTSTIPSRPNNLY